MGKLDRAHTVPNYAAGDDSEALGGGPGDRHRLDPACRSAHVPRPTCVMRVVLLGAVVLAIAHVAASEFGSGDPSSGAESP